MKLKIEQNIPVAPKFRPNIYKITAAKMDVGDSVLFNNKQTAACLIDAIVRSGHRAVRRSVGRKGKKWRVWKGREADEL